MAKINNTAAYATATPTADSIVIGSTESGGDTKNFLMSAISTFVLGNAVTPTLDDVCQQGNTTTTSIQINNVGGLSILTGPLTSNGSTFLLGSSTVINGTVDINNTADIADTLTLSKASGTGLSLPSSSISVGGSTIVSSTAVVSDGLQTNTASFTATASAVQCSVAATFSAFDSTLGGTTTVNGALDANSTADIADRLTLSNATGGVLEGTNGLALLTNGFTRLNIASTGEMTFLQQAQFTQKVIFSQSVPSSASDTGTTGQIAVDADYIYVCTATDTWKRVAIATW